MQLLGVLFAVALAPVTDVLGRLEVVSVTAWNYSEHGADWPGKYYTCGGIQQSPVDIRLSEVKGTEARNHAKCEYHGQATEPCFYESLDYINVTEAEVTNNGRNIQVNPTGGNLSFGTSLGMPGEQHRVEFGGVMELKQFHFHHPSEHTIDGQHFAMEMHMVHENAAGETSVISILFEQDPDDQDNEFLTRLGFVTNGLPAPGENISKVPFDTDSLKLLFEDPLSGDYYRYDGSLTTPPCTEAVHWFVMSQTAKVSALQVDEFFHKVGPNNRQVQTSEVVVWKNLYSLVDNNVAPACPAMVGECPGPDCVQPVHGCETTCRVMDNAIAADSKWKSPKDWVPMGRFDCPKSCPIRAPCTQFRDLRCIMGSDTVKFVLNWEGTMESDDMLNSGEITPNDCKYYVSTSQPDPATHECSVCTISGCSVCFNPEKCATCIDGYEDCSLQCPSNDPEVCDHLGYSKGNCCDKWGFIWNRVIPVIWQDETMTTLNRKTLKIVGSILGILVLILVCILCAPRRDQGGYEDACIMARLTLPRDYLGTSDGDIYPWYKFWQWHVKDRCGEGIFLFFNFYLFVFVSVVCIGATSFYFHSKNPQLARLTGSGFEFGENIETEGGEAGFLRCPVSNAKALFLEDEDLYAKEYTGPLFHAATTTWALALGLSFVFSILVEAWRVRFKAFHSEKNIAYCCLQVENLPRMVTKAGDVEAWFEQVCVQCEGTADDVVGASLGFLVAREDYTKLENRCNAMVDEWQDGQIHAGTVATSRHRTEKQILAQRKADAEVTSILNGADGSGYAYVVFRDTMITKKVAQYLHDCNSSVQKKDGWLVKQFTGRASVKPTHVLADFVKPLLEDVAKAADKAGIPSVGLTPDNVIDNDRNAVFTVRTDRGEMKTVPNVERVKAPPENIRWANLCMQREEVWVKITQVPARVILSMLLLLCFFVPTGFVFARYARIKAGDSNQLLWKAISQVLAAIYASSYNAAMITAINCSESVGAVIRDGEDLVALTLVLISTAVLTLVNVTFTMNIMVPAYMDHMSSTGMKPTRMDASANSLYNLIFPSLIAMRYIVEPCLKYFLPQFLNRFILPKLVKVERTKFPRMLQWPEISPVWTYGDLILNTSLCCSIFFFITDKSSTLFLYFALVLLARYAWLAIVWCRACSYRRIGTAKLFRFALGLWSIPTGILAGNMGFWWMWHDGGLAKFPPRGLPNGPVDWDPSVKVLPMTRANTCFWVHLVIYAVLVLGLGTKLGACLGKGFVWCCGDRDGSSERGRKTVHTYEELKAKCPADFFNTNAPVVLASRRVYGSDDEKLVMNSPEAQRCAEELEAMLPKAVREARKPLVPYEPGREYQQGKPFDNQYIKDINPHRVSYLPTVSTNKRITNAR